MIVDKIMELFDKDPIKFWRSIIVPLLPKHHYITDVEVITKEQVLEQMRQVKINLSSIIQEQSDE